MKKRMFYPLWKVEELENKLHEFELDGYRLESIKYAHIFEFAKAQPKNADYVITYLIFRDFPRYEEKMLECQYKLLSEHSANLIPAKLSDYMVYRVTGDNRDFDEIKKFRERYFKHVLFQHMLLSLLFFILGVISVVAGIFQVVHLARFIFCCIYLAFSLAFFSYSVYGYIKYKIKCR